MLTRSITGVHGTRGRMGIDPTGEDHGGMTQRRHTGEGAADGALAVREREEGTDWEYGENLPVPLQS